MSERNSKELKIAVVGASGAVGREMVSVLEESSLDIATLQLFASERSAGEAEKRKFPLSFPSKTAMLQLHESCEG